MSRTSATISKNERRIILNSAINKIVRTYTHSAKDKFNTSDILLEIMHLIIDGFKSKIKPNDPGLITISHASSRIVSTRLIDSALSFGILKYATTITNAHADPGNICVKEVGENAANNISNLYADVHKLVTKELHEYAYPRANEEYVYPNLTSFKYNFSDRLMDRNLNEKILKICSEYNNHISEYFLPISDSIKALVEVINSCSSTKRFETQLPDLTGLYPDSVKNKLNKLQENAEVSEEKTEEQKKMNMASHLIMAAALVDK